MKKRRNKKHTAADSTATEILLTPDGRVLVHNLTSAVAEMLSDVAPGDAQMISRSLHSNPKP